MKRATARAGAKKATVESIRGQVGKRAYCANAGKVHSACGHGKGETA